MDKIERGILMSAAWLKENGYPTIAERMLRAADVRRPDLNALRALSVLDEAEAMNAILREDMAHPLEPERAERAASAKERGDTNTIEALADVDVLVAQAMAGREKARRQFLQGTAENRSPLAQTLAHAQTLATRLGDERLAIKLRDLVYYAEHKPSAPKLEEGTTRKLQDKILTLTKTVHELISAVRTWARAECGATEADAVLVKLSAYDDAVAKGFR